MKQPMSAKVCVVGGKEAREKVIRSLVGNMSQSNSDACEPEYTVSVSTNKGEIILYIWDVILPCDIAPLLTKVVVYVADNDLYSNMKFFKERCPLHIPLVSLVPGDRTIQDILTCIDKNMVKESVAERLRKLQVNLASIIRDIDV